MQGGPETKPTTLSYDPEFRGLRGLDSDILRASLVNAPSLGERGVTGALPLPPNCSSDMECLALANDGDSAGAMPPVPATTELPVAVHSVVVAEPTAVTAAGGVVGAGAEESMVLLLPTSAGEAGVV